MIIFYPFIAWRVFSSPDLLFDEALMIKFHERSRLLMMTSHPNLTLQKNNSFYELKYKDLNNNMLLAPILTAISSSSKDVGMDIINVIDRSKGL